MPSSPRLAFPHELKLEITGPIAGKYTLKATNVVAAVPVARLVKLDTGHYAAYLGDNGPGTADLGALTTATVHVGGGGLGQITVKLGQPYAPLGGWTKGDTFIARRAGPSRLLVMAKVEQPGRLELGQDGVDVVHVIFVPDVNAPNLKVVGDQYILGGELKLSRPKATLLGGPFTQQSPGQAPPGDGGPVLPAPAPITVKFGGLSINVLDEQAPDHFTLDFALAQALLS
jgi:hypothetical protein